MDELTSDLTGWTPRTISDPKLAAFRAALFKRAQPPVSFKLAKWAEANIVLPAGQSARPGSYKNWPYLIEVLDSISAPEVEFVTVQKASPVGYTKSLIVAIAAQVAIDPCAIGLLVPVEDDARDYATDEIEPLFQSSPSLNGLMIQGRIAGRTGGAKNPVISMVRRRRLELRTR